MMLYAATGTSSWSVCGYETLRRDTPLIGDDTPDPGVPHEIFTPTVSTEVLETRPGVGQPEDREAPGSATWRFTEE